MKIFITGIRNGFGNALASAFKSKNHEVKGIGRDGTDDFHTYKVDLADLDGLERFVKSETIMFDLLILNAGTMGEINKANKITFEEFKSGIDINLFSNKLLIDWALKNSCKKIISISSGAASRNYDGWLNYCVGKAALRSLMGQYQKDFPSLKFIQIAPGILKTSMNQKIKAVDQAVFPEMKKFHETPALDPVIVSEFLVNKIDEILSSPLSEIDLRKLDGYPEALKN